MISIQGGSALSGRKIAELRDDTGINISERNRQWNEFTVIYWLWKHAVMDSEYIGLCHYRRIFDADKVENRIKKETPDVILAEPEVLFPSILYICRKIFFTGAFHSLQYDNCKKYRICRICRMDISAAGGD